MRACHESAFRLLQEHKIAASQVFRVSSAGDTPSGLEEVDYLDEQGRPHTAYLHPNPQNRTLIVEDKPWDRHHDE
jgi:hypothetical protein